MAAAGDRVYLQVHHASGLRSAGAPYCVVRMGAHAARTQAARGGDTCWNEQLALPYSNEERLLLEVRDDSGYGDGLLGQAAMSLPSVAEVGGEWVGDLTLYHKKSSVGMLNVRVRLLAGPRVIASPTAMPCMPCLPAGMALATAGTPSSPIMRCSPSAQPLFSQTMGTRVASYEQLPRPTPALTHCQSQPLLSPPQPLPLFAPPLRQPVLVHQPQSLFAQPPVYMQQQPQRLYVQPQPLFVQQAPVLLPPKRRLALPPRQSLLVTQAPIVQSVVLRRQQRTATVATNVVRQQPPRQGGGAFGAGLVGGLLLREL